MPRYIVGKEYDDRSVLFADEITESTSQIIDGSRVERATLEDLGEVLKSLVVDKTWSIQNSQGSGLDHDDFGKLADIMAGNTKFKAELKISTSGVEINQNLGV